MKTPQLLRSTLFIVAGLAIGCSRQQTTADARQAAAEMKTAAAKAGDQFADSWITTKIQAQYFADADVKARYINVSTRNGRVTLSGRVENENSKQQAVQIALSTDGVRDIEDHLTVGALPQSSMATRTPEKMDSAWITTKIQAKYFADPQVNGRDINVSTSNGIVNLTGRVNTAAEKQQAVSIARNTEGVTQVEDRLALEPSGGERGGPPAAVATTGAAIDDARTTAAIQSKYFLDDTVKARKIDVDTRQGVVTLRGEVSSDAERAQALLLARSTQGVQRVEDLLTVNSSSSEKSAASNDAAAPLDDGWLTTKIQSQFFLDGQIKTGSIDVTSKDGVVTLDGTVPSEDAHRQALTIARQTEGVVQVVDRLKVQSSQTR
jgi:osmotically-inducible protein OsmY